jgi:N6-L-threonylcarbamoyladenine synthase
MTPRVLLGIETSCDDTAAAVLIEGELVSSVLSSQSVHVQYGGVVPELASRDHQRLIVPVVLSALRQAGVGFGDLDAVAVTYGPGLAGSLLVGLSYAKGLALGRGLPLIGVNHLEGHIHSLFVDGQTPTLPMLCLIVSGGHTQLVHVDADYAVRTLGRTRDDAAGEAFDKVAKLMGLPYPGGPEIDRRAASGDAEFVTFPRTHLKGFDFSFSGIKTSMLYHLNAQPDRDRYIESHLDDLCASFQQAVVDMLVTKVGRAIREEGVRTLGIAGGVSANSGLRRSLGELAARKGWTLILPSAALCTDNAAMIAMAGYHKMQAGHTSPLTLNAQPALAL